MLVKHTLVSFYTTRLFAHRTHLSAPSFPQQLLLERQAVTILADSEGRTPLHMIADVLRVEVHAEGTDAERIAEARSTAVSIAEKLLMCKANPNVRQTQLICFLTSALLNSFLLLCSCLHRY